MEYEVVRTADDGYLVYSGGSEATRYDQQLRLRGPIDKGRYTEVKEILSNVEIVEADHRIEALNKFVDAEKALTAEVLKQMKASHNGGNSQ